jgi:hypothetical protein
VTGWISYTVERQGLRLIYNVRVSGEIRNRVNELIPFASTAPHIGGSRLWLLCPSCGRRCRVLYGGERFRCRECQSLTYRSQQEDPISRATTQAHQLRARLGQEGSLDEPFPQMPKGMHWTTYARLEARDEDFRHRWSIGAMQWLEKRCFWPPDC